ncbi:head GIN domain-containing protein [Vaginella massiliensis]|uniref:head GIN domain-containing protein n=1 Tax=Vaginella massiliensis TaxID=1816680 RepID=UPI000B9B93F7|nr:head GIN domain-containing protein [Vaginella massiliensis]
MKKTLTFCMTFLMFIGLFAQKTTVIGNGKIETEQRNTADFTGVNLRSFVDVEVLSGSFDQKIEVIAERNILPYITTEIRDKKLIVGIRPGISIKTESNVKVRFKSNTIKSVEINGSGDFKSTSKNEVPSLTITILGSGDVKMNTNSERVNVNILGSGDVDLVGFTQNFTATINGSGDVDALGMKTSKATLTVAGSGDTELWVEDELAVNIVGSGDVYYKANPKLIINNNGSGVVRKK